MDKINEKIKAERINMGVTQEAVASVLGITAEQVDDFENGRLEHLMTAEQILKPDGIENYAPESAEIPEESDFDLEKLSELGKIILKDIADSLTNLE